MGRVLRASATTVQNRIERLSRNALCMHDALIEQIRLDEDLAADGFVSFTQSQYHPHHLNLLAGTRSQFAYFWNEVTVSRSGRMTAAQKRNHSKRAEEWTPDEGGISHAFQELFVRIADLASRGRGTPRSLFTDRHTSYLKARNTSSAARFLIETGLITHHRISSRKPRTRNNPLFPVNYLDREIRKDLKNHVRETVAFARNQNNMMHRMSAYLWHHNYVKPFRISPLTTGVTHAMKAGLSRREIATERRNFFTERAFLSRSSIRGSHRELWLNKLATPMSKHDSYCPAYVTRQARGEPTIF
jgi:hypothetical protein